MSVLSTAALKRYYLNLLVVIQCIMLSGCATTTSFDDGFFDIYSNPTRLGIYSIHSKHYGDHALPLITGLANIGASPSQVVGNTVADLLRDNPAPTTYSKRLDIKVFKKIQSVFSEHLVESAQSSDIAFNQDVNVPKEGHGGIGDFVRRSKVDVGISVEIFYSIAAGWTKPLLMEIDWLFFDYNGKLVGSVKTTAHSNKTNDVFPNTLDPKYEKTYSELAVKNAESLILILNTERQKVLGLLK